MASSSSRFRALCVASVVCGTAAVAYYQYRRSTLHIFANSAPQIRKHVPTKVARQELIRCTQHTEVVREISLSDILEHGVILTAYLDRQFYVVIPRSMSLPCRLDIIEPQAVAGDDVVGLTVHSVTALKGFICDHLARHVPHTPQFLLECATDDSDTEILPELATNSTADTECVIDDCTSTETKGKFGTDVEFGLALVKLFGPTLFHGTFKVDSRSPLNRLDTALRMDKLKVTEHNVTVAKYLHNGFYLNIPRSLPGNFISESIITVSQKDTWKTDLYWSYNVFIPRVEPPRKIKLPSSDRKRASQLKLEHVEFFGLPQIPEHKRHDKATHSRFQRAVAAITEYLADIGKSYPQEDVADIPEGGDYFAHVELCRMQSSYWDNHYELLDLAVAESLVEDNVKQMLDAHVQHVVASNWNRDDMSGYMDWDWGLPLPQTDDTGSSAKKKSGNSKQQYTSSATTLANDSGSSVSANEELNFGTCQPSEIIQTVDEEFDIDSCSDAIELSDDAGHLETEEFSDCDRYQRPESSNESSENDMENNMLEETDQHGLLQNEAFSANISQTSEAIQGGYTTRSHLQRCRTHPGFPSSSRAQVPRHVLDAQNRGQDVNTTSAASNIHQQPDILQTETFVPSSYFQHCLEIARAQHAESSARRNPFTPEYSYANGGLNASLLPTGTGHFAFNIVKSDSSDPIDEFHSIVQGFKGGKFDDTEPGRTAEELQYYDELSIRRVPVFYPNAVPADKIDPDDTPSGINPGEAPLPPHIYNFYTGFGYSGPPRGISISEYLHRVRRSLQGEDARYRGEKSFFDRVAFQGRERIAEMVRIARQKYESSAVHATQGLQSSIPAPRGTNPWHVARGYGHYNSSDVARNRQKSNFYRSHRHRA